MRKDGTGAVEGRETAWKKTLRKVKEVGLKNVVVGSVKRAQYGRLLRKYGFDTWHLSPYEWRKYIQESAAYINAQGAGTVVDIGCGLGGLLRHVKADKKIGLDAHEEVIRAARELCGKAAVFEVGSFDTLEEKPVDYLVTLGFMHGGTEETWIVPYRRAARKNDVRHFIVDTVPAQGDSHLLDWGRILPTDYKRIERLGPFLGGRYVEVWAKASEATEKSL